MNIEAQSHVAIEQCDDNAKCLTTYILTRNQESHRVTNAYIFMILVLLVYAAFNTFFDFIKRRKQ